MPEPDEHSEYTAGEEPASDESDGQCERHPTQPGENHPTQLGSGGASTVTPHGAEPQDLSGRFFYPAPGKKLGKYVINAILGQGGMGIVLEAWDPDLQRRVAIKILGPQLALSSTARRRFLREARAAASINHPNVLTIHAVEQHTDVPYLVMELVTGRTLKAYVGEKGALDSIEVIRISHQIAMGLAAAHAQGVIHRDVKPGNVMLDEGTDRVWLTDFGLARAAIDNVELTSHDHAVGTPAYMSPEQVRGAPLDARSDLFGFGCLIYFMFTGHSPFQGRVTAETWNRILSEDPVALTSVHPAVPPILSEIALRMLEKNPNDRYQSAAEVAQELERFLMLLNQAASDEIAPLLKRSHARGRSRRWYRTLTRHRRWTLGALVLVPLVLAGAFLESRLDSSGTTVDAVGNPASFAAGKPAREKLQAIRVGSDAQSDCATIAEALQLAGTRCVITVAGPGPYYESVTIAGPEFDGLQLIAEPAAIWSCPPHAGPDPLRIADVRGVTVRGFNFLIQSPDAHGVEVTDAAEDILLERCRFEHQVASPKLSLLWIAASVPVWNQRLRVKDCYFNASGRSSSCVSISDGQLQGSCVELIGCRFHALTTHLYVTDSCGQLQVSGCVFVGGQNAINLSLKKRDRDYRYEITNNTFVSAKYWLGLMDSFRLGSPIADLEGGRIANNLILGSQRVQGGDDQLQHLIENWQISDNWWERGEGTRPDADRDGQLATMTDDVHLLNRSDEEGAGYLVPAADSPLADSGHGGDLPSYVGAFPPPQ